MWVSVRWCRYRSALLSEPMCPTQSKTQAQGQGAWEPAMPSLVTAAAGGLLGLPPRPSPGHWRLLAWPWAPSPVPPGPASSQRCKFFSAQCTPVLRAKAASPRGPTTHSRAPRPGSWPWLLLPSRPPTLPSLGGLGCPHWLLCQGQSGQVWLPLTFTDALVTVPLSRC